MATKYHPFNFCLFKKLDGNKVFYFLPDQTETTSVLQPLLNKIEEILELEETIEIFDDIISKYRIRAKELMESIEKSPDEV